MMMMMMWRLLHCYAFPRYNSCFTVIQLKTLQNGSLKGCVSSSLCVWWFSNMCAFLHSDETPWAPSYRLSHPTLPSPQPSSLSLHTTSEPSHWKLMMLQFLCVFNFQPTSHVSLKCQHCFLFSLACWNHCWIEHWIAMWLLIAKPSRSSHAILNWVYSS